MRPRPGEGKDDKGREFLADLVRRIERLLQLVENGAIADVLRLSAAKQISHTIDALYKANAKVASQQGSAIISKVREAAAFALEQTMNVIMNAEISFEKPDKIRSSDEESGRTTLKFNNDPLNSWEEATMLLKQFDLMSFMSNHDPLVASSGNEFQVDLAAMSMAERLKFQKKQLRQTLEIMEGLDNLADELVEDADLMAADTETHPSDLLQEGGEVATTTTTLSARQQAMQRRRARLQSQAKIASIAQIPNQLSKAKLELPHSERLLYLSQQNTLIRVILALRSNMLNCNWTVRHGALLALREVLQMPRCQLDLLLSVILLRDTLGLLSLDRFGDFVGEQMIAPVRETAAQLLAVLMSRRNFGILSRLIWERILDLASCPTHWQVRHAGLLAIKYLSAVDTQVFTDRELFLRLTTIGIQNCADCDEDVRALAADLLCCLLSREAKMYREGADEGILLDSVLFEEIVEGVMSLLEEAADASISAGTLSHALDLMQLVLERLTLASSTDDQRKMAHEQQGRMREMLLVLLPFMRHPILKVRQKTLEVLERLPAGNFPEELCALLVRLLVQNMILEGGDESIRRASFKLALEYSHLALHFLGRIAVPLCAILCTPSSKPFDQKLFVFIAGNEEGRPRQAAGPALHEIGFKVSDQMLLREEDVLQARRLACRLMNGIISLLDPALQVAIRSKLQVTDAQSYCVILWIFEGVAPDWALSAEEESTLWPARLYVAKTLAQAIPHNPMQDAQLVEYLEKENVPELQSDLARFLSCALRDRPELLRNLLPAIISKETRARCMIVLREVYKQQRDHFGQASFDRLDLEGRMAHFLVLLSAMGREDGWLEMSECLIESMSVEGGERVMMVWREELPQDLFKGLFEINPKRMIVFLLDRVVFLLRKTSESLERALILRALRCIFEEMAELSAPYANLFLVPVLGRIADSDQAVRQQAARLFSLLVKLVPLRSSKGTDNGEDYQDHKDDEWDARIRGESQRAQEFSSQFLGDNLEDLLYANARRTAAIADFDIPVKINAQLRPYQQAGVNWLAFLNRYGLNGVLCDDMGLGKTLQTLCMLASDHHMRNIEGFRALPSLIVCPSSLIGHWRHEMQSYTPTLGTPLVYAGKPEERRRLLGIIGGEGRSTLKPLTSSTPSASVMLCSYDTVRNDASALASIMWNYVILDEGHLIKNPKTKLTLAIKALRAEHRLALSGTPIQNKVIELWSLFDFLMPGLLGNESEFMENYGRAIMAVQPTASRMGVKGGSAPCTTSTTTGTDGGRREFEQAERRLEALHKQVLPFLLRRMKEDVLKDLPPKIIQDYECDPSPVQRLLYNEFFGTELRQQLVETLSGEGSTKGKPAMHIFQALQYLRKICVHPALVLDRDHPQWEQVQHLLGEMELSSLEDLSVAPKLQMLRELLLECGIESNDLLSQDSSPSTLNSTSAEEDLAQHRVLIFAQQRGTLDLIERLVLKRHFTRTRFLRLDGSMDSEGRFAVAQRFNGDPSIEILLLTTQVGGLGLNLTGADTVIFVEHDWNPMRDLQAMDRAHRLGQKRVVTVYRLIVRDTLEQRIMGLQRWKTRVASTIIQQQALTAETKDGQVELAKLQPTDLLDLLSQPTNDGGGGGDGGGGANGDGHSSLPKAKRPRKGVESDAAKKTASLNKWLAKQGGFGVGGEGNETNVQEDDDEYGRAFGLDNFLERINRDR